MNPLLKQEDSKKRKTTNVKDDKIGSLIKLNDINNNLLNGSNFLFENELDEKSIEIDFALSKGGKKRQFSEIDQDLFISKIPKPKGTIKGKEKENNTIPRYKSKNISLNMN